MLDTIIWLILIAAFIGFIIWASTRPELPPEKRQKSSGSIAGAGAAMIMLAASTCTITSDMKRKK